MMSYHRGILCRERQGKKRSVPVPSPSTTTVSVLKGLAMVLSYLLRDGLGYADDYRSVCRLKFTRSVHHSILGWYTEYWIIFF